MFGDSDDDFDSLFDDDDDDDDDDDFDLFGGKPAAGPTPRR